MPRSHWKGSISFGLVNIPIILCPVENKTAQILFHQIDKRDNARIKFQRINAKSGKLVPWEEVGRGFEYTKENIIPVPNEILKKMAGDNARSIDIENFIDKKELDILAIEKSYYLIPQKKAEKGYILLREALKSSNKIGIAKVIISTKEYLSAIIPYHHALILFLLKYDNEIRKIDEFDIPTKEITTYKVNKKEIEIAKKLIQSMSTKWKPKNYKDKYQEALHLWVEESVKKLPHTRMKQRKHAQIHTNIVNFVDLLRKSLSSASKKNKTSKGMLHQSKVKDTRLITKH